MAVADHRELLATGGEALLVARRRGSDDLAVGLQPAHLAAVGLVTTRRPVPATADQYPFWTSKRLAHGLPPLSQKTRSWW